MAARDERHREREGVDLAAMQRIHLEALTRGGNCSDNAAMKSWVSTLKSELGERRAAPRCARARRSPPHGAG